MNRLYAVAIGGTAIASASIAVFLYYFFMPAWLLVERIEGTEHDVISLPYSAVEASPKLKAALQIADERYAPNFQETSSFKLTSSEGSRILEIIRESEDFPDIGEQFRIESDDKYYLVSVLFRYELPGLA